MFNKLALFALIAPLVSALTIIAPEGATSSAPVTVQWISSVTNDPPLWSLELANPAFRNALAVANNVDPTTGSITFTMPAVAPGPDYSLQAVDVSNVTKIFAESAKFSIGGVISSSITISGTTAASDASSSSSAGVVTGSVPPVTTGTTTTGAGTSQTTTPTSSGTGSTPSSTAFNSGASSLNFGYTGMLLTAIAGAAVFAL